MDIKTGAINWTNRVIGYDTWHAACLFSFVPAVYALCPNPTGTDADFGQAPIFYTVGKGLNKTDLVGAGQKTGVYWAFDAETGQTVWATRVSPGGIASRNSMMILPGYLRKLRRGQKSPEFSATGQTGTSRFW